MHVRSRLKRLSEFGKQLSRADSSAQVDGGRGRIPKAIRLLCRRHPAPTPAGPLAHRCSRKSTNYLVHKLLYSTQLTRLHLSPSVASGPTTTALPGSITSYSHSLTLSPLHSLTPSRPATSVDLAHPTQHRLSGPPTSTSLEHPSPHSPSSAILPTDTHTDVRRHRCRRDPRPARSQQAHAVP